MHSVYEVEANITNQLPPNIAPATLVVGIVGSNPSTTAMSPRVWNRVFRGLKMDCTYVSFDIAEREQLASLTNILRRTEKFAGFNVTVPYKTAIMKVLDHVEAKAQAIGAVNTVVRETDGTLIGYNTDGRGALDNVCTTPPGSAEPLVEKLTGKTVLMIGAGGAAKAAGFFLAEALGDGTLYIANRTTARSQELAVQIGKLIPEAKVEAKSKKLIPQLAPVSDLIYNMSTVGQGGLLQSAAGYILLEPFSPLGAADSICLSRMEGESDTDLRKRLLARNQDAILENIKGSLEMIVSLPGKTVVADAIHTPAETVLLAQARQAGHRTVNGKGMNLGQALDGFINKIMALYLEERGWRMPEKLVEIRSLMAG